MILEGEFETFNLSFGILVCERLTFSLNGANLTNLT